MAMFIWELVHNTRKRCYHILETSPEEVDAIEIVYNEIYEMLESEHIDIDTLMRFLDIDLTGKSITLCGNNGDPIYHPEFIELVDQLKQKKAQITIVTNGSYKKAEWWQQLTQLLDQQDHVQFSIDGVPDNFTQYRVNADWDSIHTGINVAAQAACGTSWKYIPFSYNQDTVDQAQTLCADLGIDQFILAPSARFDSITQHLVPRDEFVGEKYQAQQQFKQHPPQAAELEPECQNNKEHYISADGFYSPCCYVGNYNFFYKTQFGKNKKQYKISDHTMTEILNKPTTLDFYSNLAHTIPCQFNCVKIS
jgi:organic radical activating enzyme